MIGKIVVAAASLVGVVAGSGVISTARVNEKTALLASGMSLLLASSLGARYAMGDGGGAVAVTNAAALTGGILGLTAPHPHNLVPERFEVKGYQFTRAQVARVGVGVAGALVGLGIRQVLRNAR